MIAVALTQILIAGLPAAMLLDRTATRRRLLGLGFLLGTGITYFTMLALPHWSPLNTTITILLISATLWTAALRATSNEQRATRPHVADAATLLLIATHALVAIRPIAEWDFWAIWGLKARVFLAHRGIDWSYLEHPWNVFQHSDYPPLLPLNYAFVALRTGEWSDAGIGILGTCFAAALLLLLRDFFEQELNRTLGALATLGVASVALSPFVGVAEAPMIAFSAAGLLYVRRGAMAPGAVLLGLAACTKNEGLTFILAAAGALFFARRARDIVRLWPALVVVAPWLVLRGMHALPTHLLAGSVTERIAANALELPGALGGQAPVQPLLWIAIAAAFILCVRELARERFLLAAALLQLLFYAGAYLVTPYGVRWHVAHSWQRLLEHAAVPFAFVALTLTGARLRDRADEGDGDRDQRAEDEDRDEHADEGDERRHAEDERHRDEEQLQRQ